MDIPVTDYSSLTALFQSSLEAQRSLESEIENYGTNKNASTQKLNPGAIGAHISTAKKQAESPARILPDAVGSKDIWNEDDIELVDAYDKRSQPEHTIKYRQKVSSEDMYLQMSGKTPGFQDTDELVITIDLPHTEFKDIELTCTDEILDLRCPN
ncbi:Protein pih1d3 [Physocladia obscura]|uniref:Protein pih1d3 n=1 Tax=Physocladia obscura TaxID=109957 RepID=A0AAD5SUK2_9FUNG|nr:Protein pih1d3 [Physocladia obscura]